jgi:OmpA-OmpF porin, OOP family
MVSAASASTKDIQMREKLRFIAPAVMLAAVFTLCGCGTSTVSKGIDDAGVAGELVFPDIQRSAWLKEGTFPSLDALRNIGPGVSKDQLLDRLGPPHFREGFAGVREWDYVFNFRTGKDVATCQYKVIFDKDYKAGSFHWAPSSCAERLNMAALAPGR